LDNAKRADSAKEELIPMITSLSEYPPGHPLGDKFGAGVNDAPVLDTGGMAGACRNALDRCPAVEVLERCVSESVKASLAGEESPKGGVYVIRVAPDKSVSVVEIRGSSRVQADAGREDSLRRVMGRRLAGKKESGERHGKPESREFIAHISAEGWIGIVETTAQSSGGSRRGLEYLDPTSERDLFSYVHPDYDDTEAWARYRKEVSRVDLIRLVYGDGHRNKARELGS
jgi:hypothetical protein